MAIGGTVAVQRGAQRGAQRGPQAAAQPAGARPRGAAADVPALASALRVSVMRLGRRLRAQRTDTTHTLTQLAALATLDRHGPMTPAQLAHHEGVQPPSMTRVLAALEADGLAVRAPHPTDGRQAMLRVTASGRDLLERDRRRREEWLASRLPELSPDDRDLLRRALPLLDRLAAL